MFGGGALAGVNVATLRSIPPGNRDLDFTVQRELTLTRVIARLLAPTHAKGVPFGSNVLFGRNSDAL